MIDVLFLFYDPMSFEMSKIFSEKEEDFRIFSVSCLIFVIEN